MHFNQIPDDLKEFFPEESYLLNELIFLAIKNLEEQPDFTKLRVFLSYLYFKAGCYSFSKRELLEIKKYSDSSLLDRIVKSLGGLESETVSRILAEVEL